MTMEPSSCWKFSMMEIMRRGKATAVLIDRKNYTSRYIKIPHDQCIKSTDLVDSDKNSDRIVYRIKEGETDIIMRETLGHGR